MLAATANDLHQAMTRIRLLAYVILDGTLIPIDRVHDRKPYYSGKHRRHGMNVQVIADAAGRLFWASAALPGSAHDLTAARTHGIIAALTNADVIRCRGKRAVATLKTWKILTKLRCSPSRTTAIVQAILVLHHVENPTYQGGKTLSHADRL